MPLSKPFKKAAQQISASAKHLCKRMTKAEKTAAVILLAALLIRGLLAASLPMERIKDRPASLVVTDKEGAPLRGTLASNGEWRLPVPLAEMGKWMPAAAVEIEDRRFYSHMGVDLPAIFRALRQNIENGRVVSGASTITSQVIRLSVERKRTPVNKILEFIQATALESRLTKEEILEIYLNSVPFGGNTRGVEAAARTWFGKPAKELSLAEAALLTGLLRGPAYYRPDRHPLRARELRDRLIDTLRERGLATDEEARRAKSEPLPQARQAIASANIQAAAKAAQYGEARKNLDSYGRFRSTLDTGKQKMLLAELQRLTARMEPGITAAAVLVENKSGKVRGYIGNAKEGTNFVQAWVDCAASPRSPGSALKPFVYALAFESGAAAPDTMIADVPSNAANGGTRNFDRLFRGPVSARTALCDSLNVPAVKMLQMAGMENTLALLQRLGFKSLTKEAKWYGESLALGGCEVSLLELARAYRTLANGGADSPLLWNERGRPASGSQVISEAAAALTLDILKDTRRNLPTFGEADADGKIIAFKTGTSYGLRDAWTAAVTPEWTLIAWAGDPSGKPHRSLVGLSAAAPAAVSIMLKLTPKGAKWFDLPPSVSKAQLCPLSGAPRNQWCPQSKTGLRIGGISNSEPCTLHVMKNGEVKIEWPEELARFFANRGGAQRAALVITSPKNGAAYFIAAEKLLLTSEGGRGPVYWFVDNELIGTADEGSSVAWTMKPGKHKIAAADEYGACDEAEITVRSRQNFETDDLPLLEEN